MRVVIDTNIFFSALNPKSRYYPISRNLLSDRFSLLVSTPILLEYEEILQSENVIFISPTFRFQLPLADKDDEKFVDCAVCGIADFLVTDDRHFNMLKDIPFPRVKIVNAMNFIEKYL